MNEQIKQLCEQSKVYANESTKDFTGNEPVVWMDYYTEKFAELIVRECAELLELEYGHCALTGNRAAESIKKHFGIDLGIEE